jgi:hypothetical protein
MSWFSRRDPEPASPTPKPTPEPSNRHPLVELADDLSMLDGARPVLLHALDGFLSAGAAGRLASQFLLGSADEAPVVASFDIDALLDYRARRPPMAFDQDHYAAYDQPRLVVRALRDRAGTPYLLLAGPEPDFHWEAFVSGVQALVERLDVVLTVGLGSIPMAVPHTRPIVVTSHATRGELLDRPNLWSGRLTVPASAQSLLELRLGEAGHDAMGHVAHVPHYLTQIDFPSAALAVLEAAAGSTKLSWDLEDLRSAVASSLTDIDAQVQGQDGGEVLASLEQQYDAFTRGAENPLLTGDGPLPSADELGRQVEQFLAGIERREGQGD